MDIKTAEKTLNRAKLELERAEDDEDRRQAAEKGWRAAREAVNAVMELAGEREKGTRTPSEVEAFEIDVFGRGRGSRHQPLAEGYSLAMYSLHGDCFYDGKCPSKESLRRAMFRVESLIEQAEADWTALTSMQKRSRKRRSRR